MHELCHIWLLLRVRLLGTFGMPVSRVVTVVALGRCGFVLGDRSERRVGCLRIFFQPLDL
jgi:hypothetical protein